MCAFCADHRRPIDYKDHERLGQYISDRGKILPRRATGACAKHQRVLAEAVKRARHIALLPYAPAHIHATGGVGIRQRGPRRDRFEGGRPRHGAPIEAKPAVEAPPEGEPQAEVVAEPVAEEVTEAATVEQSTEESPVEEEAEAPESAEESETSTDGESE